jgi:hypothetical protein
MPSMLLALEITFLGMDQSRDIESIVRCGAPLLERIDGGAGRCHVVLDKPQRPRHRGEDYAIRVYVAAATGEVSVMRQGSRRDLFTIIRDALDAATQDLEAEQQRRNTSALKGQQPKHESRSARLLQAC